MENIINIDFVVNEINTNKDYEEFRKPDLNQFLKDNPNELQYWIDWFNGSDMSQY